jgi:hypothetical protein
MIPHQGFAVFAGLLRKGHSADQMNLKGTNGDVSRWNSRVKLARNFRGIQVDSYSSETLKGYNAFFQVFLTHSALELYLKIIDVKDSQVEQLLKSLEPEKVVKNFFGNDKDGRLFTFLHRWVRPKLKTDLTRCRDGSCCNVCHLSASIRHVFVHGHMAARSNEMNPTHVAAACNAISDFLLDFMEYDFTSRIGDYMKTIKTVTERKT